MLKKFTMGLALGALAISAPLIAQDGDLRDGRVMEALGSVFGEPEPLTDEQQARVPFAEEVVGKIFPLGTYVKMMEETMKPMMDGMMSSMMQMPIGELVQLTGLSTDVLSERGEVSISNAMAIMDPAFQARSNRMSDITVKLVTDVMNQIEPSYRKGLSRAYAVRFTQSELAELSVFFDTPTGAHYATESMLITTDPQVMSAMSEMMPAIFEMMPKLMGEMTEASTGLQEPRKFSELSKNEQAKLSRILGISREELMASEPSNVLDVQIEDVSVETKTAGDY